MGTGLAEGQGQSPAIRSVGSLKIVDEGSAVSAQGSAAALCHLQGTGLREPRDPPRQAEKTFT